MTRIFCIRMKSFTCSAWPLLDSAAAFFVSALLCASASSAHSAESKSLAFVCEPENDLYGSTTWPDGRKPERYTTLAQALEKATEGSGILVLADDYPAKTT